MWRTGSGYFDTSDVGRIEILSSKSHRNQEDDGLPGLTGCRRAPWESLLTQPLHILFVDWTQRNKETKVSVAKWIQSSPFWSNLKPESSLTDGSEMCFFATVCLSEQREQIHQWKKLLTGTILCYIHSHIWDVHWCCHSFPETESNNVKVGSYVNNWAGA